MTDHKFADDEIIKALECCAEAEYCATCLATDSCKGMDSLMENALTLINRQKAEIEEKSKNITFAAKELIRLDRERSEVIKEFAENVKAIFECVLYFDDDVKECILNEIDELVKEMTEGNHESQST